MPRYYIEYALDCGYAAVTCCVVVTCSDEAQARATWPELVRGLGHGCTAHAKRDLDLLLPVPPGAEEWTPAQVLEFMGGPPVACRHWSPEHGCSSASCGRASRDNDCWHERRSEWWHRYGNMERYCPNT